MEISSLKIKPSIETWRRNGKYSKRLRIKAIIDRYVDKTDTCWICLLKKTVDGYCNVKIQGVAFRAHRVIYEFYKGKIKSGLVLDHLCRVRNCVNPEHLEQVSRGENSLRGFGWGGVHARKTHCVHGHSLKGRNLYKEPRSDGGIARRCRICKARHSKKWSKKNPEKLKQYQDTYKRKALEQ